MATRQRTRREQGWEYPFEADFTKGIVTDAAHVAIPPGGVRDSVDFLLHEPGKAIKRGGTTYAGPAMTGATAAVTVAYAPFASGHQLLAISEIGHAHLYKVTPGTTTDLATLGAGFPPLGPCPFFVSAATELVIFPAQSGTTAAKKYDGTTVANLGGSPPAGTLAVVYKNRLWLANSDANPNRLWASGLGNAESWDTTVGWIDFDEAITALDVLPNAILVGSASQVWRLVGSTPPPGTDMEIQPVSLVHGIPVPTASTAYQGQVIYANPQGVFMTGGSGITNLVERGGVEKDWQAAFENFTPANVLCLGVHRGHLFAYEEEGTAKNLWKCNLRTYAWERHSNIRPAMFAASAGVLDELWYGDLGTNRVVALSDIWTPAAGNKADANGTAVAPRIQLRPMMPSPGVNHYFDGWVALDMRDAGTDNPTMAVQIATGLEAESFVAVAESPLAESSVVARRRFTISKETQAVSVKLTQTGPSSQTEIHGVQMKVRPQTPVFGGQ